MQDDQEKCSSQCQLTLSIISGDVEISDETFRELNASAQAIALYLQNNESRRQHYLQIAMTTPDDDKRNFLTNVFKYLPAQQKQALGDRFVTFNNWHARAIGVVLITDDGASDTSITTKPRAILSNELNPYVKNTVLSHLKQNAALRGDLDVLS